MARVQCPGETALANNGFRALRATATWNERKHAIDELARNMTPPPPPGFQRDIICTPSTARLDDSGHLSGYAVTVAPDEPLLPHLQGHLAELGEATSLFAIGEISKEDLFRLKHDIGNGHVLDDRTPEGDPYEIVREFQKEAGYWTSGSGVRKLAMAVSSPRFAISICSIKTNRPDKDEDHHEHFILVRSTSLVGVTKLHDMINADKNITAEDAYPMFEEALRMTRAAQGLMVDGILRGHGLSLDTVPNMQNVEMSRDVENATHFQPVPVMSTPSVYLEHLKRGEVSGLNGYTEDRYMLFKRCTSPASPQCIGGVIYWDPQTNKGHFLYKASRCNAGLAGASCPLQKQTDERAVMAVQDPPSVLFKKYQGYWTDAGSLPFLYTDRLKKSAKTVRRKSYFGTPADEKPAFYYNHLITHSYHTEMLVDDTAVTRFTSSATYAGSYAPQAGTPHSVLNRLVAAMEQQAESSGESLSKKSDSIMLTFDAKNTLPFVVYGDWSVPPRNWLGLNLAVSTQSAENLIPHNNSRDIAAIATYQDAMAHAHCAVPNGDYNTAGVIAEVFTVMNAMARGTPPPFPDMENSTELFELNAADGTSYVAWTTFVYAFGIMWSECACDKRATCSVADIVAGDCSSLLGDPIGFFNGTAPVAEYFHMDFFSNVTCTMKPVDAWPATSKQRACKMVPIAQ